MKKKLVVCDIDSTLIVKYQPLSDRAKTRHLFWYCFRKNVGRNTVNDEFMGL